MTGRSQPNFSVAPDLPTERIVWILPLFGILLFIQAVLAAILYAPRYAVPFAAASVGCLYLPITHRWRLGVYLLILFMPFAGVPTILLYPAPAIVTQIKDVLFVVPTYVGFCLWFIKWPRSPVPFRDVPVVIIASFVALTVIQLLNPSLVDPLVGLIGLKVRLFYIPFFLIGYCFVDSRQRLLTLAKVMVATGIVPALIGIVQAVFVYSGQSDLAYQWYGSAGRAVTQEFVRLGGGTESNGGIARVPSTFPFVTQYWGFLLALVPMAYALALSARKEPGLSRRWMLALCLILVAAITSGARAAYALLPVFFITAAVLEFKWRRVWKPLLLFGAGLALAAVIMGIPLSALVEYENTVVDSYASREGLVGELETAFARSWLGLGTGMSTGPARYAFGPDQDTERPGLEGYYALILVELGLVGLLIVFALIAWILFAGYSRFVRLRDPVLRPFGMSLLALFCVMTVYLFKGSIIDYDPLNVYFWMYAGILMKLPLLEHASRQARIDCREHSTHLVAPVLASNTSFAVPRTSGRAS